MQDVRVIVMGVLLAVMLSGCFGDGGPSPQTDGGTSPQAVDDAALTIPNTAITVAVTANDTDADGTVDPSTVMLVASPSSGVATVDPATGVVTYTPDVDFVGTDALTYTVRDQAGNTSNVATLTVTVSTMPDFIALVRLVLAREANSQPVAVNNLVVGKQLSTADPQPVNVFLP